MSLFLYSPVGGGHLQASRALEHAWLARRPDSTARKIDYLQFMPAWERRLWPGLYHLALRHRPSLWRSYRRWTDRPDEPRFIRDRVTRVGVDAFAPLLRAVRPQLVVSTIGGAAALAGAARARLPPNTAGSFLNALVVSGFRAHHHWARPEADMFFVASDEAKADLVHHRVPARRVFVVGVPIHRQPKALDRIEKASLRARLGLHQAPVLLVSSGGTGAYRALDELLAALVRLDRPIDVLVFKGPAAGVERRGRMRIFRLGFREDFCDWLSASDLVVGKLGGHTAAEAFAAGVPIVVYEPIPGQEEENASWVTAREAGVWPRTPIELERTLIRLLYAEAGRLERERMARAARRLARPEAASHIVRLLSDALEARP
jgi:processive 1,2-diacylglycerol beta-glucosyltransferase